MAQGNCRRGAPCCPLFATSPWLAPVGAHPGTASLSQRHQQQQQQQQQQQRANSVRLARPHPLPRSTRGHTRGSAGVNKRGAQAGAQDTVPPCPRHRIGMTTDISRLMRCRYMVFGAGAYKGVALVAAFRALDGIYRVSPGCTDGTGLMARLAGTAGTSIGSAIALAVACEMPIERLAAMARDPATWSPDTALDNVNIFRLAREGGLCNHSVLYEHIHQLMDELDLPHDITFAQLHARTGKEFVCNATDADDLSTVYFSHRTEPHMRVADALCASMCIPGVIEPVAYRGRLFVDGAVVAEYIPEIFPEEETMGIAIDRTLASTPAPSATTPEEQESSRETQARRGASTFWGTAAGRLSLVASAALPPMANAVLSDFRYGTGGLASPAAATAATEQHEPDQQSGYFSQDYTQGIMRLLNMVSGLCDRVNLLRPMTSMARAGTIFVRLPPRLAAMRLRVDAQDIAVMWDYGKRAVSNYFSRETYAACLVACTIGTTAVSAAAVSAAINPLHSPCEIPERTAPHTDSRDAPGPSGKDNEDRDCHKHTGPNAGGFGALWESFGDQTGRGGDTGENAAGTRPKDDEHSDVKPA